MRVLVTGATGFVGRTLCERLAQSGYIVRAAVRSRKGLPTTVAEVADVGEIGSATNWSEALEGVDCVAHLAARVHMMNDSAANSNAYMETNANGTRTLARAAARAGVRRFIFLSSIKVNGEETTGRGFSSQDEPRPLDPYGVSKWCAEQELLAVARETPMTAVTVRPPLVYGPGVRANFLRLLQWVDKGRPLPLGGVRNARSLVSIWNLTDLLAHVLEHPAAANATWMVSDGADLSTPDLIRVISQAMGRRVRLVSIPTGALRLLGATTGRSAAISRLCGSLTVDIAPTRERLGWDPPLSVTESITRTVQWYRDKKGIVP
jgi:nucleoside-diphosphate-sugar epimerase